MLVLRSYFHPYGQFVFLRVPLSPRRVGTPRRCRYAVPCFAFPLAAAFLPHRSRGPRQTLRPFTLRGAGPGPRGATGRPPLPLAAAPRRSPAAGPAAASPGARPPPVAAGPPASARDGRRSAAPPRCLPGQALGRPAGARSGERPQPAPCPAGGTRARRRRAGEAKGGGAVAGHHHSNRWRENPCACAGRALPAQAHTQRREADGCPAHARRARCGSREPVGAPRMRCGWAAGLPAVGGGAQERQEPVSRRRGQRRAGAAGRAGGAAAAALRAAVVAAGGRAA